MTSNAMWLFISNESEREYRSLSPYSSQLMRLKTIPTFINALFVSYLLYGRSYMLSFFTQLLQDERLEKAGGGSRRRSSLVINRSSPDSPTPQVEIPPTTYTLNPSSNTLAPPPLSLGPPPSSRHGYHPAPSSPSKEPVQARHHHHHAYHNNV